MRPVSRMTVVRLDDDTQPPSGDVAILDPFSRTSRPSSVHVIRATGLLLEVEHSSDTVSFTLASLGPVIVTVFGPTAWICFVRVRRGGPASRGVEIRYLKNREEREREEINI